MEAIYQSVTMMSADLPYYKQKGWNSSSITDKTPYLVWVAIFSLLVFTLEKYMDLRQRGKFVNAKGKKMPTELSQAKIEEEKFVKSLSYGIDKASFGLFESSFSLVESMLALFGGYLPFLWDMSILLGTHLGLVASTSKSGSTLYEEIVLTILFISLVTLHNEIIYTPFALYSTFVIEQRHGFNKQTIGLFVLDKLKSMSLSLCIGAPVLAIVIWIVRSFGEYFYLYLWMFLFVFSIVMMSVYPEYIAPLFNKYTKLEEGPVYDAIAALAKKVSFPLTKLFVVDGSTRSAHSNAYFYGFFKNKRIVLYDTLLTQVETSELLAILGHEMGHWQMGHSIQMFAVTHLHTLVMLFAFSLVQHSPGVFAQFGFAFNGHEPVFVSLLLFSQVFWNPVEKVIMFLMNVNSRRNEFQADRFACNMNMGAELGSGLVKITMENSGAATMLPDPLYSMYHFSHPPLVERLKAINLATVKQNKKD